VTTLKGTKQTRQEGDDPEKKQAGLDRIATILKGTSPDYS
jgi:hypothetical protein